MHTANTAHKNRNGKYRFHSQAVTTVTVPLTVSPFLKKDNLGNSCVSGWPKTPKTSTAATGNSPISRAAQQRYRAQIPQHRAAHIKKNVISRA